MRKPSLELKRCKYSKSSGVSPPRPSPILLFANEKTRKPALGNLGTTKAPGTPRLIICNSILLNLFCKGAEHPPLGPCQDPEPLVAVHPCVEDTFLVCPLEEHELHVDKCLGRPPPTHSIHTPLSLLHPNRSHSGGL
jgi:hypothetical protein